MSGGFLSTPDNFTNGSDNVRDRPILKNHWTQWIALSSLCTPDSLFPKEITVHSGTVQRDKIYGDRLQICEGVEVPTIKYQLFRRPKMKYLLFTLFFNVCCHISCPSNMGFARLDSGLWEMAKCIYLLLIKVSGTVLGSIQPPSASDAIVSSDSCSLSTGIYVTPSSLSKCSLCSLAPLAGAQASCEKKTIT